MLADGTYHLEPGAPLAPERRYSPGRRRGTGSDGEETWRALVLLMISPESERGWTSYDASGSACRHRTRTKAAPLPQLVAASAGARPKLPKRRCSALSLACSRGDADAAQTTGDPWGTHLQKP